MFLLSDHQGSMDAFSRRTLKELHAVYERMPTAYREWAVISGANHYSFSDVSLTKSREVIWVLEMLGVMQLGGAAQREQTQQLARRFLGPRLGCDGLPCALPCAATDLAEPLRPPSGQLRRRKKMARSFEAGHVSLGSDHYLVLLITS